MAAGKGIIVRVEGKRHEAVQPHLHVVARTAAAQHQLDDMQDGAAQRETGDEGQAVIDQQRDLGWEHVEAAQHCGHDQRQDRRCQPMAGLGVVGDGVQPFVCGSADMVINEMGRAPVNQQRCNTQQY